MSVGHWTQMNLYSPTLTIGSTTVNWGNPVCLQAADVLGIKHKFGFQCTRKCKHVLARALRDGLFTVPPDMKLGVVAKPKSAGGRAKRAGKALEPESSESEEEDDGFSECSSDDSGEDDIE
ncbi:hypothetical protein PPROV_000564100 [Pycnococcus provasolii]|uniref:Uncharacterized protein n=1 Tax=Pycnococcus provasolii TaxID=41880 RepID=A0A830HPF3_9CHLO|nr:hypothetical protein PPROV_000564100 [Pycnococcus provasolii]